MKWVKKFKLFLFDFDGLLVNTEKIHYLAYQRMCERRGVNLEWDFKRYCVFAHYSAEGIRNQIYLEYPKLKAIEPSWEVLYAEKKQLVLELLLEGAVHLMPGVEALLIELKNTSTLSCVVTHSPTELVNIIRQKNPILNTIPHWFTRESYSLPKPNPECYLKAIKMLSDDNDAVIGFEDTPRGLQALMQTRAKPVLISEISYPEIPGFLNQGALHFQTFDEFDQKFEV